MSRNRFLIVMPVAIAAAVGIGWLVSRNPSSPAYASSIQTLPREIAAWKSSGLPLKQSEVESLVAKEENAAQELQLAVSAFLPYKPATESVGFWSPKNYENGVLERNVARLESVFEHLHRAVEKKHYQFARNWDLSISVAVAEQIDLETFARLLAADAEYKARKGDLPGALRSVRTCRRLAKFAADNPTFVSFFWSVGVEEIALQAICLTAFYASQDSQVLQELLDLLAEDEWSPNPVARLRAEAYLNLADLRNATEGELAAVSNDSLKYLPFREDKNKPVVAEGYPDSPLGRATFAEALAFWNRAYQSLQDPHADHRRAAKEIDAKFIEMRRSTSDPERVFARLLTINQEPQFVDVYRGYDLLTSMRRTARAYVGVLAFRQKNGAWPATLQQAGVAGVDAVDGKPIRYRVSADSMRVWTLGLNDVDDGGRTHADAAALALDRYERDFVYVYPWPKRL